MDLQQAKALLSGCRREELRDEEAEETEVTWFDGGEVIAEGYFDKGLSEVNFVESEINGREEFNFKGELADHLRKCGTLVAPQTEVGSDEEG